MYCIFRTILAGALVACLAVLPAFGAAAKPLGVVVASQHASVASAAAPDGATVFAGDSISTAANGALRLQTGTAQVYLLSESKAVLSENSGALDVALQRGSVRFSSSGSSQVVVRTPNALVRAAADKSAHSQVALAGPSELVVSNFRGSLEVVVGGEAHAVPEGTTYRVLIESQDQGPAGTGAQAARHHRAMMILLGAAIAGTVIAFTVLRNQSPSIP